MPAEVADVIPTLGISEVAQIDGSAALVRINGQLSIKYEFRLSIEIVVNGLGKIVQFAEITDERLDTELNQNEPSLTTETITTIIACIHKTLD